MDEQNTPSNASSNETNPIFNTPHTEQLIEEYARLGRAREANAMPLDDQSHIRMGILADQIKTRLTEQYNFSDEQIMDALRKLRQKRSQQDPEKAQ